jgi:hypothetical protein
MSKRRPFQPTAEQSRLVEVMTGWGVPLADIARAIVPGGIALATLRKHFREELASGIAKAHASIAETVFRQAQKGNVAACKLWLERAERGGKGNDADLAMQTLLQDAKRSLARKLNRLVAAGAQTQVSG